MDNKLKSNISRLYKIFANYTGNRNMVGSPNYGDSIIEWNKELFSKPLNDLDEDDLSRFTGKAITTWGTKDDLKHFLPRILELTAEYRSPYEIWITFQKLNLANWIEWESIEKVAILEYLELLLVSLINDDTTLAEVNFIDYFTAISYFYPNFNEVLKILEDSQSKAKYMHIANLIVEQSELILEKGKIDGFLKTEKNVRELQNWLLRSSLIEELSQAYFKYEDEEFADRISWAEQILTHKTKNAENKV
jgi:hypothetical protein